MQTSQACVAKMEGGRINPSVKTLQRFAEATGTRLSLAFLPATEPSAKAPARKRSAA